MEDRMLGRFGDLTEDEEQRVKEFYAHTTGLWHKAVRKARKRLVKRIVRVLSSAIRP
jgi:hypothetical protein